MGDVLVVDDVKTDRELIGKVVMSAGHTPRYAVDGADVLRQAKSYKPCLIFLDIVMPNVNGFTALRDLKKDGETASIPVVMVTTKAGDSDKFWGQKNGAVDYIVKPFTPETVMKAIKAYV